MISGLNAFVISIDRISFTGVHFVRDVYIEGKIGKIYTAHFASSFG
jgi:hypothetical protein